MRYIALLGLSEIPDRIQILKPRPLAAGYFISEGSQALEVETRRGLFAKDTAMVLDYLFDLVPLYVTPQASLYALEVAYAAYQSSLSGKTVFLGDN